MRVGVMGAAGSFTEQAAYKYVEKESLPEAEVIPLVEITAVLEAVDAEEVDLGVFPIQNSVSGIVHSSMHGASQHIFTIVEFFEMEIDQNLLVIPGTKTGDISQITSQGPALGQCASYLERVWAGVMVEEYIDTAQAAADLAAGVLPSSTAVIASARCAEIYQLEVLESSIQDLKHNFTTFVACVKGT